MRNNMRRKGKIKIKNTKNTKQIQHRIQVSKQIYEIEIAKVFLHAFQFLFNFVLFLYLPTLQFKLTGPFDLHSMVINEYVSIRLTIPPFNCGNFKYFFLLFLYIISFLHVFFEPITIFYFFPLLLTYRLFANTEVNYYSFPYLFSILPQIRVFLTKIFLFEFCCAFLYICKSEKYQILKIIIEPMNSYFSICQQPLLTYNISSRTMPTSQNCLIIDDYFIYVNTRGGKNVLSVLDILSVSHNKNTSYKNEFQIEIAQNCMKLTNVVRMIEIHPYNKSSIQGKSNISDQSHKEQKIVRITLISNIQICSVQISIKKENQNPSVTHKILQSNHLMYQPHKSILSNNMNTNSSKDQLLLNIQVLTISSYDGKNNCYKELLAVVGYTVSHKIAVNIYVVQYQSLDHSVLKFLAKCDLSYPPNVDNFEYNFTLTSPNPQSAYIYLYQIFNQKGQPLKVFLYNLCEPLFSHSSSAWNIQPEKLNCHLGSLHNHFHIKSIQQEQNDLYITYTRYAPYIDKNKIKQNPALKQSAVQTHLWIYNIQLGYTKNIIDVEGSVFNARVVYNPPTGSKAQISKSIVFLLVNQDNQSLYQFNEKIPCLYTTQIIKMNSALFNPRFSIQTHHQTPLINGLKQKYFICIENSAPMNTKLNIYEKIEKKSIYCSMWESLGSVGGSRLLQEILQML